MKQRRTLLREKLVELHYWQMMARQEARWLRLSRAKAKEIAAEMRKLQKEIKKTT